MIATRGRGRSRGRSTHQQGQVRQRFTSTTAHRYKSHYRKERALRKRGNFF